MTNQARSADDGADAPADADADGRAEEAREEPPIRRWIGWTTELKSAFLDRLAESCNITASARALGIDPTVVHHLRRRDPAFAADWAVALEAGYVMIETRLVGHVLANGTRGDPIEPAGGHAERIHVEDALRVLAVRDARRKQGNAPKSGARPLKALRSETDAAILKLLRIADRRAETG